jgi:hypothetical protein
MSQAGDCKACGNTRKNSKGGECWPCVNRGLTVTGTTTMTKGPTLLAQIGNVEDGAPWIADESIDLAVMSPPYFEADGATVQMFTALGALLARTLKLGARAFVNIGQVSEDYDRIFDARALIFRGASRRLSTWQTIAWVKSFAAPGEATQGHYTPISNSEHILYSGHELVFQFVKGIPKKAPPLAKLAVGVPYADKSNLDRGTRGKNGDLHDPGDTWFIPYDTTGSKDKKAHRHSYPAELVRRLIVLANLPAGSTVLDPFIGGGTTAEVARSLGHSVVAMDRDRACIDSLLLAWGLPPHEHTDEPLVTSTIERVPAESAGDFTPPRRRKMSKTLAALMDNTFPDPVSDGGTPMHPDDTLTGEEPDGPGDDPTNPPPIPGRMCGTPGCSNPQMHRTNSGDLCINGHGEFTGKPAKPKRKKREPEPQPDETDAANGDGYPEPEPPRRPLKKKVLLKKVKAKK